MYTLALLALVGCSQTEAPASSSESTTAAVHPATAPTPAPSAPPAPAPEPAPTGPNWDAPDWRHLPDDPQMQVNEYVTEFDHPNHGPTKMLGMPVRLSETPGAVRQAARELGQHTEEILLEVLGYDWERIAELRKLDVI